MRVEVVKPKEKPQKRTFRMLPSSLNNEFKIITKSIVLENYMLPPWEL